MPRMRPDSSAGLSDSLIHVRGRACWASPVASVLVRCGSRKECFPVAGLGLTLGY